MEDEYTPSELSDGVAVIQWIAEQPWCSGKVGIVGISWGGFNALQLAALAPEPLAAVVTVCSTDDRYADDIHFKGGCLLNDNLTWSQQMLSYSSRPPDPEIVGERWRDLWLHRLENLPLLAANWLRHQRRDAYWKHGSICESFAAVRAPVLAVGGWADAYSNAVPRLVAGMGGRCRGIVGPWEHRYPHLAEVGEPADFLAEALRWWDRWLKGNRERRGDGPGAAGLRPGEPAPVAPERSPGGALDRDGRVAASRERDAGAPSRRAVPDRAPSRERDRADRHPAAPRGDGGRILSGDEDRWRAPGRSARGRRPRRLLRRRAAGRAAPHRRCAGVGDRRTLRSRGRQAGGEALRCPARRIFRAHCLGAAQSDP